MLKAYEDWELGINPVTTGEAPWLPAVYRQAVHAVKAAVSRERVLQAAAVRERTALAR